MPERRFRRSSFVVVAPVVVTVEHLSSNEIKEISLFLTITQVSVACAIEDNIATTEHKCQWIISLFRPIWNLRVQIFWEKIIPNVIVQWILFFFWLVSFDFCLFCFITRGPIPFNRCLNRNEIKMWKKFSFTGECRWNTSALNYPFKKLPHH